jgi:hypothetical protein
MGYACTVKGAVNSNTKTAETQNNANFDKLKKIAYSYRISRMSKFKSIGF